MRRYKYGMTPWQKIISKVKGFSLIHKALLALAVAFAVTAGIYAHALWQEGVQADENAQQILAVSGFADLSADQSYAQPQAPRAEESELDALFDSALQGYSVVARLDIPAIDVNLPVLSETTDLALGYSICYFSGPEPGGEGNLVITGHNYASGAHFGNLNKVKPGDEVLLTGPDGSQYTYTVYKTETITPDNVQALSEISYSRELTLLTCEENANRRLLVRCREIEV